MIKKLFLKDEFFSESYQTIPGVCFTIKRKQIRGKHVKVMLWDSYRLDRFYNPCCNLYRGAHSVVILYDITNRHSFQKAKNIIEETKRSVI